MALRRRRSIIANHLLNIFPNALPSLKAAAKAVSSTCLAEIGGSLEKIRGEDGTRLDSPASPQESAVSDEGTE
jgi:hypothetical protein